MRYDLAITTGGLGCLTVWCSSDAYFPIATYKYKNIDLLFFVHPDSDFVNFNVGSSQSLNRITRLIPLN